VIFTSTLDPASLQSHNKFMKENFFNFIDILPENCHFLDSTVPIEGVKQHCSQYEKMIADVGGIDIHFIGIGRSGHMGFNEPSNSH
jgi:glucosamine-6-phosphate deaminase